MKLKNNTYRTKGRALFLAAIMVLSVFAMPLALSGAGAAMPTLSEESYDKIAEDGDRAYQGQIIALNTTGTLETKGDIDLFTTTRDSDGERVLDDFVSIETIEQATSTDYYVILDTEELDTGTYAVSDGSEGDRLTNVDAVRFTITEQTITVEFDEDTAATSGGNSEVDFEVSSRQRNTYAINVSADGLDADDLADIFNHSGAIGSNVGPSATGGNDSLLNRSAVANNAGDSGYVIIDDDEDVLTILNGEQEFTLDFDDVDADEYEFSVEVVDSTASASDSITVRDVGDEDASFSQSNFDVTQGDIAEISVEFDNGAEDGLVVIGNLDDDGYQLNVSIDDVGDDDAVTLYFNTYVAGLNASGDIDVDELIVLSDESDDAGASINYSASGEHSGVDLDGDILDTGSYEILAVPDASVSFGDAIDEATDIATLFIDDRGESSMNLWTASASNADDIDDLDDLTSAIEDGLLTETDTVAADDFLVHEIGADGLSGLIGQSGEYDHDEVEVTDAFLEYIQPDQPRDLNNGGANTTTNFSVMLEQQNPTANRAPKRLNLTSPDTESALTVLFDKDSNTFYVMLDISNAEFTRAIADEDEFDATINIKDARLLDVDTDDFSSSRDYENNAWDSASQLFEFVDRDGEFDLQEVDGDDYVVVENAADQEVTGTTNIAPGSEVTVRLRGTDGASFVKSNSDVVINSDQTFVATFDFSDRDVDDEFIARLRSDGSTLDEEDGLVVEQVVDDEEAPVDEEEPVDDDEEPVDEEEPVDDDEEPVDDATDDETPGFGALVALIALLGAALLAARRQN